MLPHRLHYLYNEIGNAYKGNGECGIDTQMTKGLAFAQETGCIQFLVGEWKRF